MTVKDPMMFKPIESCGALCASFVSYENAYETLKNLYNFVTILFSSGFKSKFDYAAFI